MLLTIVLARISTCSYQKNNKHYFLNQHYIVIGQFAENELAVIQVEDWSSCGLVNSWTSQLAKMFYLKFAVNIHNKCDLWQITQVNTFSSQ